MRDIDEAVSADQIGLRVTALDETLLRAGTPFVFRGNLRRLRYEPHAMGPYTVVDAGGIRTARYTSFASLIAAGYDMLKPSSDIGLGQHLPTDAKARKDTPLYSGVMAYFPDALCEVARLSKIGNDQHNPGQPMHWAKDKSTDHEDCIARHLLDHGKRDTDGVRHSAKVAWRALAMLQIEIEKEGKA